MGPGRRDAKLLVTLLAQFELGQVQVGDPVPHPHRQRGFRVGGDEAAAWRRAARFGGFAGQAGISRSFLSASVRLRRNPGWRKMRLP